MVVDVADPIDDSRYRYWGSGMTDVHGRDMTGKCPYDLRPPNVGAQIKLDHTATVTTRKPTANVYGFMTERGFMEAQSVLRLPLSDDGERVTKIVICIAHNDDARKMLRDRAAWHGH